MPGTASEVPDAGAVWSAEDTAPAAIEEALRHLLQEQHARDGAHAPARVLNLVVVVDSEWRGEIMNRLEQVGRYHASRTILCTVESGRETIDASVVMMLAADEKSTELTMTRERVILTVGDHDQVEHARGHVRVRLLVASREQPPQRLLHAPWRRVLIGPGVLPRFGLVAQRPLQRRPSPINLSASAGPAEPAA